MKYGKITYPKILFGVATWTITLGELVELMANSSPT